VTIQLDKDSAQQLFSVPGITSAHTVRELKAKAADLKSFASCIKFVDLAAFSQNPQAAACVEEKQRQLRSSGWSMQDLFYAGLVEHLNKRSGRYCIECNMSMRLTAVRAYLQYAGR
jgi:hypothetical protein